MNLDDGSGLLVSERMNYQAGFSFGGLEVVGYYEENGFGYATFSDADSDLAYFDIDYGTTVATISMYVTATAKIDLRRNLLSWGETVLTVTADAQSILPEFDYFDINAGHEITFTVKMTNSIQPGGTSISQNFKPGATGSSTFSYPRDAIKLSAVTNGSYGIVIRQGNNAVYQSSTPSYNDTFTYTISSTFGETSTASIRLVAPSPPEFLSNGETDPSIHTNDSFAFQIEGSRNGFRFKLPAKDPDGDAFIYESADLPAFLQILPTGELAYVFGQPIPIGISNFTVKVKNDAGEDPAAVTVTHGNAPPEFLSHGETDPTIPTADSFDVVLDQSFSGFRRLPKANDPDNSASELNYSATRLPPEFSVGIDGTLTRNGNVPFSQTAYGFTLKVEDPYGETDVAYITIHIEHSPEFNFPEYVTSIKTDDRGIVFQAIAYDPNPVHTITYSAPGLPAGMVFVGNDLIQTADIVVGVYKFEITAVDGDGGVATTSATIIVDNAPRTAGYKLFVKGTLDGHLVDHNDIDQGDVGNCGLLSALASVAATDPNRIISMITPLADGRFSVKHFDALGNPVTTIAGPFYNFGSGQVGFGDVDPSTGLKEIWVMVIEQAIFNHLGGTPNGSSCSLDKGMTLLTGAGGSYMRSVNYSLQQLTADLTAGKFITVQSKPGPSAQSGLVGNHAYAVLGVVGNSVRLFNPWGSNPNGQSGEILVPWEILVMDTYGFWVR